MEDFYNYIFDLLVSLKASESLANLLSTILLFLSVFVLVIATDLIIRKLALFFFSRLATRSKSNFDDILVENKVPRNLAQIITLFVAYELIPGLFFKKPYWEIFFQKVILVVGIITLVWGVKRLLSSLKQYFKTLSNFKDKPIDSYIQVIMIFVWLTGLFAAVAIIFNISIIEFLAGLGTISAVIILVFRDTILGFVASIQVSVNDMVRIGDWITLMKYGADGTVIEINLATVKVRNFDNTISTIPTYALISDSFKNWRGMTESGGRRIKRSLFIKMDTVKFLTMRDFDKLIRIERISDYLSSKVTDINHFNEENKIDKSLLVNGRNLTNIGVYRKYIETYVENHSAINKDLTIMVRQLQPSSQGLPLEIYAFSKDKRWENYEYIIADIFDHAIAAIPYFDLELFELPSSTTFTK